MAEIANGGPAFPVDTHFDQQGHQTGHTTYQFPGMTLRDYFAAKALAGWMASSEPNRDLVSMADEMAEGCYAIADAMLIARQEYPSTVGENDE